MPTLHLRQHAARLTPAERSEIARRAVNARWARHRNREFAKLRQIGTAAIKAYAELRGELHALRSTRAVELERALHRLISAFANLWEFSGHDLPANMAAEYLHILDDLKREAMEGAALLGRGPESESR